MKLVKFFIVVCIFVGAFHFIKAADRAIDNAIKTVKEARK